MCDTAAPESPAPRCVEYNRIDRSVLSRRQTARHRLRHTGQLDRHLVLLRLFFLRLARLGFGHWHDGRRGGGGCGDHSGSRSAPAARYGRRHLWGGTGVATAGTVELRPQSGEQSDSFARVGAAGRESGEHRLCARGGAGCRGTRSGCRGTRGRSTGVSTTRLGGTECGEPRPQAGEQSDPLTRVARRHRVTHRRGGGPCDSPTTPRGDGDDGGGGNWSGGCRVHADHQGRTEDQKGSIHGDRPPRDGTASGGVKRKRLIVTRTGVSGCEASLHEVPGRKG
jgi:hypothetical protein